MKHRTRLVSLLCLVILTSHGQAAPPAAPGVDLFEKKIRPVLVEQCYGCHSVEAQKKKKLRGGLFLDTRAGLLRGGDSGPAVVPGKPNEGALLAALRHTGEVRMPPKGALPAGVVADFEAWIRLGAPDPRDEAGPGKRTIDIAEGRKFWAYQPPRKRPPPEVKNAAWAQTPIDRFVLAGLEAKGLQPAADADLGTLVRRLHFDLLGLPPTPEKIAAFEKALNSNRAGASSSESQAALEDLVDHLLASPHFGERWGRHWLDVARFGESLTLRGFVLKEAWRYRDYVIDSYNQDVPFDRFVREQLAGDLLPAANLAERRRQLIPVAFLTLGNTNLEEQDKQQLRMDVVDEQLDTIGRALLAQTLGCARCHDHKFDPIPTRDYYALAGILRSTRTLEHANVSQWLERPLPGTPEEEAAWSRYDQAVAALETRIKALKAAKDAGVRQLEDELKHLRATAPKRDMVMTVREESVIEGARVHVRGSVHSLGDRVPRGFLQVATGSAPPALPSNQSGRVQLAAWIADQNNPLTARVFVNRAWHWLFGAGLVRSTDNFGTTGDRPSHPELLDYLAGRFVENGWSVKQLVREIVLSRTYRLSTGAGAAARQADPDNRLLAHTNRRRLDAECIRDTILAVSGQLKLDRGGPTFPPGLPADYGYKHTDTRRSVYVPVFRNALPELFEVFDFADPSVSTGQRNVSTTAPQALFMLNHPFVVEQARHAAARLLAVQDLDDTGRLTRAYRLTLGRAPTEAERVKLVRFLAEAAQDGKTLRDGWALVFQALFASLDFRYE
jgi:cytochrome c553